MFLLSRFTIALAVLAAVIGIQRGHIRSVLHWSSAAPGFFLAAGYLLQTEGLRTTSPSASAFLTGLSVILVPALGWLLGWSRVGLRFWIQALLALAGLVLLQGGRPPAEWHLGETLTIACAIAFAAQILLVERLVAHQPDPVAFTTGQIFWGWLALLVWASLTSAWKPPSFPPDVWLAILFTGAIATAGAFLVQTWAQKSLGSTVVAVCFSTEPVFATLVSVGLFGDRIGGEGVAGVVLIFVALLLTAVSVVPVRASVECDPDRC
jgi:drug/metabolite transporter (DMT)-like permease